MLEHISQRGSAGSIFGYFPDLTWKTQTDCCYKNSRASFSSEIDSNGFWASVERDFFFNAFLHDVTNVKYLLFFLYTFY